VPTSGAVHVARGRAGSGRPHQDAMGWLIKLDDPALTIHVDMMPDGAFYSCARARSGLPPGTSGRVACLLSGGTIRRSRPTA
jgi:adenylyl- and sulfurtransferase ThiI